MKILFCGFSHLVHLPLAAGTDGGKVGDDLFGVLRFSGPRLAAKEMAFLAGNQLYDS